MQLLNQITNSAKQQYTLNTSEGESFDFLLKYNPVQSSWVYDIIYNDFFVYNRQLTISPNCLYQYKNILPFGLACSSSDGGEPQNIEDFSSGRVQLRVLNSADVNAIQTNIYEI